MKLNLNKVIIHSSILEYGYAYVYASDIILSTLTKMY